MEWRASSPASAVASRAAARSALMRVVLTAKTRERTSPGAGRPPLLCESKKKADTRPAFHVFDAVRTT